MKPLIIGIVILLLAHAVQAQFGPLSPPQKKTTVLKKQASPGLESEPTRTQPAPSAATSYSLSTVNVSIRTGSDNKESLSDVRVLLGVRRTGYGMFTQYNLTSEMRVNTSTSIGLDKQATAPDRQAIRLSDLEQHGLALTIIYFPNFPLDAWKIESVSLILEFRDASGSPQSSPIRKTVTFPETPTFLDNFDKKMLVCTTDGYFNPRIPFVAKQYKEVW